MATKMDLRTTRWQLTEVVRPGPALLDKLAAITRSSFTVGDMLPGLPTADGVSDTAASITEEMDSGVRLWMVHAGDGRPIGCVRAIPRPDATWQIRRLAVTVDAQGYGLGRLLVRGLEQAAMAEGIRRLVVWALVERGVPPFYSMLGYRTTGHFGTPDKLLSEAIMELELGGPRPVLTYPWGTEPQCPHPGAMVSWFDTERHTVAVTDTLAADASTVVARHHEQVTRLVGDARFLGGDGWSGCGHEAAATLGEKIASRADAVHGPVLLFDRPCTEVVEFTMPRTVEPELLALWRMFISRSGPSA